MTDINGTGSEPPKKKKKFSFQKLIIGKSLSTKFLMRAEKPQSTSISSESEMKSFLLPREAFLILVLSSILNMTYLLTAEAESLSIRMALLIGIR